MDILVSKQPTVDLAAFADEKKLTLLIHQCRRGNQHGFEIGFRDPATQCSVGETAFYLGHNVGDAVQRFASFSSGAEVSRTPLNTGNFRLPTLTVSDATIQRVNNHFAKGKL